MMNFFAFHDSNVTSLFLVKYSPCVILSSSKLKTEPHNYSLPSNQHFLLAIVLEILPEIWAVGWGAVAGRARGDSGGRGQRLGYPKVSKSLAYTVLIACMVLFEKSSIVKVQLPRLIGLCTFFEVYMNGRLYFCINMLKPLSRFS
mmetsp:Transcript_25858/g.37954  ORF Transcript_25858/g.37954 Transcript_25858/m.37954 type:complete len:145 (-) Transcript_25858:1166-1600(-)